MTDLSATPSEAFLPVDGDPLDVRLQMLANGYEPIPVSGKRPLLPGWPQVPINEESVRASGSLGLNTGVRTARTPMLDFDLLDEGAARLVEGIARHHIGVKGEVLLRIGLPPKRAIPLRTNAPFKKIVVALIAPNSKPGDKPQKIEVLGDGQQIAVAGIHPDTGKPYVWRDGRSPVNTVRDQLPLVDEAGAQAIVDECVAALVQQGWKIATPIAPDDNVVQFVPLEERIEAMSHKGVHGLNETLLALTMDRLDDGTHSVEDVITECLKRINDCLSSEERENWDWNAQRHQVREMCLGHILKKHKERPALIDLLPDALLEKWRGIEVRGGQPILRKRKHWGVESEGAADPIPDVEVSMPTVEAPSVVPEEGERKLRFRLIKLQDMRPGLEPAYLVDELIPSAGLVLVWGKQKTFKSFWLLDLFVHVAMGWPYRDHAVRQGPVIYCAFEGGHGYKGRIEAIRRHYGISDDVDVPLYVMPGQVDLIADEKALVEEFRYQLGTVVPAVVVLDTLNRSLSGSESSDKDMTLYVKAAEAVRKAFGCLCVIVHHCGYDDTHARGHTSLPAAVDAELSVMRDEGSPIVLVTVKAMRDGPEGMVVRSRALPVPLDPDQNGKPRSSIVITPDDDDTVVTPGKKGGPTDTATPLLVEVLRAAIDAKGEYFTPDGKLPLQAADQQHVRELFYRRYVNAEEDAAKSHSAQKNAYNRRKPNAEYRSREHLTEREVGQLIEAMKGNRWGHRDAAMVLMAFRHGLRASELVDLRWDQVDLEHGLLHVRRLKKGTPATHPLTGRELRAMRRLQREQDLKSPFVFTSERGTPFTKRGFQAMVERASEAAGFDMKIHPHMLRHACGFKLANDGVDARTIQAYLGHKSIQHTVRYTELAPSRFKSLFRD